MLYNHIILVYFAMTSTMMIAHRVDAKSIFPFPHCLVFLRQMSYVESLLLRLLSFTIMLRKFLSSHLAFSVVFCVCFTTRWQTAVQRMFEQINDTLTRGLQGSPLVNNRANALADDVAQMRYAFPILAREAPIWSLMLVQRATIHGAVKCFRLNWFEVIGKQVLR